MCTLQNAPIIRIKQILTDSMCIRTPTNLGPKNREQHAQGKCCGGSYCDKGTLCFFVSRRFASRIHEISDLKKKKALVLSLRAGYTRLRDQKKTYWAREERETVTDFGRVLEEKGAVIVLVECKTSFKCVQVLLYISVHRVAPSRVHWCSKLHPLVFSVCFAVWRACKAPLSCSVVPQNYTLSCSVCFFCFFFFFFCRPHKPSRVSEKQKKKPPLSVDTNFLSYRSSAG